MESETGPFLNRNGTVLEPKRCSRTETSREWNRNGTVMEPKRQGRNRNSHPSEPKHLPHRTETEGTEPKRNAPLKTLAPKLVFLQTERLQGLDSRGAHIRTNHCGTVLVRSLTPASPSLETGLLWSVVCWAPGPELAARRKFRSMTQQSLMIEQPQVPAVAPCRAAIARGLVCAI